MTPCTNPPTHRIIFTKPKMVLKKCRKCFSHFEKMAQGHENEFKVELLK